MALAYKKELEAIDPDVEYLMTLYLSPELTPDEIRKAKAAGIAGNALTFIQSYRSPPCLETLPQV